MHGGAEVFTHALCYNENVSLLLPFLIATNQKDVLKTEKGDV